MLVEARVDDFCYLIIIEREQIDTVKFFIVKNRQHAATNSVPIDVVGLQ